MDLRTIRGKNQQTVVTDYMGEGEGEKLRQWSSVIGLTVYSLQEEQMQRNICFGYFMLELPKWKYPLDRWICAEGHSQGQTCCQRLGNQQWSDRN